MAVEQEVDFGDDQKRTQKNMNKRFIVAMAGMVLAAASSHASLTTVQDIWGPQPNNATAEWNLYNSGSGSSQGNGIMEYIYGVGDFTRVNDSSDIEWAGTPGSATFDAVYAGDTEALYTTGLSGVPISPAPIVSGQGQHLGVAPSRSTGSVGFIPESQPFLFLDETTGGNASSDPALNSGVDRMVTFSVSGYLQTAGVQGSYMAFTSPHYVIAFEDGSDFDYNDLVVEVSGVTPVPEPTTMISGALLLLPFGASTMRILRKNRAV